MAFDFNWKPQKLPLQMINGNSRAASDAMAGYVPQEADPNNSYYTQGIPAENAAAMMQGYTEEQPAPYVGRTPEAMNNAGQGAGYQFNDPEFDAYMQQQEKAANEAAAKEQNIAKLKSDITALEAKIAENKKKLSGFTGNADKIAALEARKINSQDPTMIWRWKMGQDAAKQQRAEDLKRIEAEKAKNEARNKEMNQYKIDAILKGAMPGNARTRDELMMMEKSLNDAEELAKQYKDTDMLKRIDERRAVLRDHVPVSEKSNIIESDFIKESSMVGKIGGRSKEQFVEYVTDILEDPANEAVWRNNPGLQQKLYQAIGTNTKNTPKPKAPQEQ